MSETVILLELIRANNAAAIERDTALSASMASIDVKVTSLIESRTLARGAWKATAAIAGLVSGIVTTAGLVFGWLLRYAH